MSATLVHHRFTVDEYERMIEMGIVTENDQVELISGEIIAKMAIGDSHVGTVNRNNRVWNRRLGDDAVISVQNPVVLDDSEPEPDIAVLAPRGDFYASAKPRASDVRLLIEVADSSLDFDRDVKAPLYARAGIADYWIANLIDDCIEVHRRPQPDGTYADIRTFRRGESLQPLAFPGTAVTVDELLG